MWTYHSIRGILLRKPANVAAVDTQHQREVCRVRKAQTITGEACPDVGGIDLTNHDCAHERDGEIPSHEVGACVLEVRATECADKNEDSLICDADHLYEQGVQSRKTEAFDDDGAELPSVSP